MCGQIRDNMVDVLFEFFVSQTKVTSFSQTVNNQRVILKSVTYLIMW